MKTDYLISLNQIINLHLPGQFSYVKNIARAARIFPIFHLSAEKPLCEMGP